jgi:phasin family protein
MSGAYSRLSEKEEIMAKKPENESFMDLFDSFGRALKVPRMDIEAVLENHRKNLEALQKSASATASGASSILAKQREALQQQLSEIAEVAKSYGTPAGAQEAMASHADFVRRSFEETVKNASEVAQIAQKSGAESLEILRARIRDSMDELRKGYEKQG